MTFNFKFTNSRRSAGGDAPFTESKTVPGSAFWESTVTGLVTVRCWGAGADGTDAGGGGGEFAASNVAVVKGVSYEYRIGQGGINTIWDNGGTENPLALSAVDRDGATGGTGDILQPGGSGGGSGGGGGGAGGTEEPGHAAANGHGGAGAGGDGGTEGGGRGGDGSDLAGSPGQAPGGGGGAGLEAPGAGAPGQIDIIYPAIP